MGCSINLLGALCENIDINLYFNRSYRPTKGVNKIILDINKLLVNPCFDKKYISYHILNKIVQMTKSECGFIGQMTDDKLYIHSMTNISWDDASSEYYHNVQDKHHIGSRMNFITKDYLIIHKYEDEDVLPKGHPHIKRFLGVPCVIGNKLIAYVGLCNKVRRYNPKDAIKVQMLLNILGYLFIK